MEIAEKILEKQNKDGMLRRALERIIQLYTDKSHFVYELLQNAEDAGAHSIKFIQYPKQLVVLHDGKPFTEKNLQGLCDIGKSDKVDDLNQIGEFGVGFKSVFGICEKVRLYSSPENYTGSNKSIYIPFAVEIQDFTRPVDIPNKVIESAYTTMFEFPYEIGFTFSGFDTLDALNAALSKRLQDLGITTLLFMKNLETIEYQIKTGENTISGCYLLDKQTINDHCSLVSALGEKDKSEESISYLKFSRPIESELPNRTVDIAFPVMVEEDGKYSFTKTRHPFISVYFPTETESKLDFIAQGPYRTTPNRSSVPSDNKDNIELAELTAKLLYDSILELKEAGKLSFSLLRLLPIDKDRFENYPLFSSLYRSTKALLTNKAVLPCKSGGFTTAEHAKIARSQELADLLDDYLLTELINDDKAYYWLPTILTETNKPYKKLYEFLTSDLDIDVIRPENLRSYFNENTEFLKRRDNQWLIRMYSLYESIPAAFVKNRQGSNMLTAAFIKTATGDFVPAYRKSAGFGIGYLPNIFLPTGKDSDDIEVHFVDSEIYKQCKSFFDDTLHLEKPNEYEYFLKSIRKRYVDGCSITDSKHIDDIKTLISYRNVPGYQEEISNIIQNTILLHCYLGGKPSFVNPRKTKMLLPKASGISIEGYYKNIAERYFVDVDYYTQNGITIENLELLGVSNTIVTGTGRVGGTYYTGNPGRQPEWHTYGDFKWKLNLDMVSEVLMYISTHPAESDSLLKSHAIFKTLQDQEKSLTGTVYIGGTTSNISPAFSDIITLLTGGCNCSTSSTWFPAYHAASKLGLSKWDGRWLYAASGELVAQKDISKHDLNANIYGQLKYDSKLYEYLGFKKNAKDRLEDFAKEYDNLSDEKKEAYFELELRQRFGISISDLEENYGANASGAFSDETDEYDFPSSNVKNWDALKKHAAEMLCFADPVNYEYKVRRIRVSKKEQEVRAYLMNMYRIEGTYTYACQMCHRITGDFKSTQIINNPTLELDPMNLCLCPNCAAKYTALRNDGCEVQLFIDKIDGLSDREIGSSNPVSIGVGCEEIWFTQTHIAEIRELRTLKAQAESSKTNNLSGCMMKLSDENEGATRVYDQYVGKRVKHKSIPYIGTVNSCDGTYISIIFDDGPKAGVPVKYLLESCLKQKLLEVIE